MCVYFYHLVVKNNCNFLLPQRQLIQLWLNSFPQSHSSSQLFQKITRKLPECIKKRFDEIVKPIDFRGGDEGIRTPDLLNANQALSQLSYAPTVRNAARITPATNIILNYLAPVKRFAQKAQLINAARIRPVAKLSRAEKIPTAMLPLPTSSSTLNGVNFSNT